MKYFLKKALLDKFLMGVSGIVAFFILLLMTLLKLPVVVRHEAIPCINQAGELAETNILL